MEFDFRKIAQESISKLYSEYYLFKCYKTGKEIGFAVDGKDAVYPFESLGECIACNKTFHYSVLALPEHTDKPSWPVVIEGAYCTDCYVSDDNSKDSEDKDV